MEEWNKAETYSHSLKVYAVDKTKKLQDEINRLFINNLKLSCLFLADELLSLLKPECELQEATNLLCQKNRLLSLKFQQYKTAKWPCKGRNI